MVDDFDGDEYELRAVVDAAQTPPFLTDRRVVVARGVGRFTADDVAPLVAYLGDPLPTHRARARRPAADACAKSLDRRAQAGRGRDASTRRRRRKARDRASWIEEQVAAAGLRLDAARSTGSARWMGEDAGRLAGRPRHARSAPTARRTLLRLADIEPFLGEAGGVPPWDLTDAIDRGDTTAALRAAAPDDGRRRAPPAAGDGDPARPLHQAAGARRCRCARRGRRLRRRSGSSPASRRARRSISTAGSAARRWSRAIGLLAQADLDLRGAKDWPEALVMEVLVARLSRLGAPARRR